MCKELNLEVNDIEGMLGRLVYVLGSRMSLEERVYVGVYRLSEGGYYDRVGDLGLMRGLGISRQQYSNILGSLEKKGLLKRGDGVLVLNINLLKRGIEKLVITKKKEKDENK